MPLGGDTFWPRALAAGTGKMVVRHVRNRVQAVFVRCVRWDWSRRIGRGFWDGCWLRFRADKAQLGCLIIGGLQSLNGVLRARDEKEVTNGRHTRTG